MYFLSGGRGGGGYVGVWLMFDMLVTLPAW